MFEVKDLRFSYKDKFSLSIGNFIISRGQRTLLRGPSGSGKTTFLMLLRGILLPDSGSIQVLGKELTQLSERERRQVRLKEVGSIFQHPTLLPYLTVKDNLRLNRFLGHATLEDPTAHPLVEKLGLLPLLNSYPSELSGGEVQRVSLVRPFLHKPSLIVADEPTNHLDQVHRRYFVELLDEFQTPDNSTLIVSHDESLIPDCDKVIDFSELKK